MLCIHPVSLALRLCIASPDSFGSLSEYVSTITLMNNIHALINASLFISLGGGEQRIKCRCDAVRKESPSNQRKPI